MKIGLVCPYNMFHGGGVQEVVLALRDGIQSRGHEAYIITPQPRTFKGTPPEGIILIGGGTSMKSFKTTGQISASVDIDKLQEMLDRYEFDVIHFHEPWVPVLSRQIVSRSKAINIATFHAALPNHVMTRTIEKVITPYTKSILKYLDVLTAVSTAGSTFARSMTDRKIHIIANGIDLTKYTRYSLEPREQSQQKTILYIGRLEKRKGVMHLLEAYAMLRKVHPEFTLVIAGDGPDRNKLRNYVRENDIQGVSFLGYVEESTKLRLLHEADLFCSPALYGESFGIVLLEAMASGCVTVAGNNAGYEGVLKGRGQLSIVNPKDTVEFARRLALLGLDEELRSAWRDWASDEVARYNYNLIIDQYVALYEAAYAEKHSLQPA
jgi:phosphatidylinositol alpha-mannosyltransferase